MKDASRRRSRSSFLLAASAAIVAGSVALAACHKGATPAARSAASPALVVAPLPTEGPPHARAADEHAAARAHLIGRIGRQALGPFLARTATEGVAVWIVGSEHGDKADVVAVPLGTDGAPLANPSIVASAPKETTALVVRPAMRGGKGKGWLIAWAGLVDRGESVSTIALQPDGTARGGPADLQRTNDHVAWVDLVPTAHGVIALWAEETVAGTANILSAALEPSGRTRSVPVRVARDAAGWADAPAAEGAALALVTQEGGKDAARGRPAPGSLAWLSLDEDGRAPGAAVNIGQVPTVSGDVDMVAAGDGWLLAWTDRTREEAQVAMAAVDPAGKVHGPTRAMNALGGSVLVRLASGPAGVALAWEEPHGRARPTRTLYLARVTTADSIQAQPGTSLEVLSSATPELVPADGGFALLAAAPGCGQRDEAGACAGEPTPTFVRLDPSLAPVQAEPLRTGGDSAPAALAWGLDCASAGCVALAADNTVPTPIFAMSLPARASPFAAPVVPEPPPGAPRVTGLVTLASGEPFADVAAVRTDATTMVAMLTDASPRRGSSGDEGGMPPRSQGRRRGSPGGGGTTATTASGAADGAVAVRPVDDQGQPVEAATALSSRAVPVGRVALAAAPAPGHGAAAAWVAVDHGDPQVHVARVDPLGRVVKDVQLTTARGDASDVAIAWAGDGWLVAWVDARDGNGEVYAAKVSRELDRIGPGQRITNAPGDAADVALVVQGDTAWLAWSDPRENPGEGLSDIHVTTLHARDATRAGEDVRVLATAAHSRSPALAISGAGALVAWIEEAPPGIDAPGSAMAARLDPSGHVVGAPVLLPLAGAGRPTAVSLSSVNEGVRAIVARSLRGEITLDAMTLGNDASGRPSAWPLLDLDAPAPFDTALTLVGNDLFYTDAGPSPDQHRVRRAHIDWR